jgi:putative ABC transport system permease protein
VREGLEAGMKKKIADVMNLGCLRKMPPVSSLEEDLENKYNAEKGFRNALMAGNAVILVILVIGLLGYTTSEAGRHQKELAIRKISGATTPDILKVFILELEYIAIPSVLAGLIGVWFTVNKWMQNFAVKVPMHWGLFVLCSLAVLLSVALVAAVNYYRFANRNPVEALRYE